MEHYDLLPKSEIQAAYGLILMGTFFGFVCWFNVLSPIFSKRCRHLFEELARSEGMSLVADRIFMGIGGVVCLYLLFTVY